ncbi:MAG TPA: hypothetical protein VGM92_03320 [Candidatus Kapabacteria bacterium]
MKSITFTLALLIAAFAAGCSSSSSPSTTTNTATPIIPTIGTTFQTADIDNGSDLSHDTIATAAVVDGLHTGSTVRAVRSFGKGLLTTYESFLPSGDIAIQGTIWGEYAFKVLPFASHTTVRDTFWDGTAVDSIAAVYNGPGTNFTLNGQSYPTDSVTVSYTYSVGDYTYEENYSFIPALGVLAYDRSEANGGGICEKLVSYGAK